MGDQFIIQDVYLPNHKAVIHSAVKSLTCMICKKEQSGATITARVINGRTVFLCPLHMKIDPKTLLSVR